VVASSDTGFLFVEPFPADPWAMRVEAVENNADLF
jgi:hypothetical protein